MHTAADEVQRRAHREECLEDLGERLLGIAVVQMPAVVRVVGHTRIRRRLLEHDVHEFGAGCLGDAQCASQGNVYQSRAACTQCVDANPCGDTEWFAVIWDCLIIYPTVVMAYQIQRDILRKETYEARERYIDPSIRGYVEKLML